MRIAFGIRLPNVFERLLSRPLPRLRPTATGGAYQRP